MVMNNGTSGLRAENIAAAGEAIFGLNTAATGTAAGSGVVGLTAQANALASGVWGENSHVNGTGVIGLANGQGSTVLVTGSGGAFTGAVTGAFARSTTGSVGQGLYADQFGDVVRVAYWSGGQFFKINGLGTVSTNVVDVTDPQKGRITMYAPETPEVLFMEFGQGKLVNGRAHVKIDPRFTGTVQIDDRHPLRVFIQLEGDENTQGVVVKNKTASSFDVVELRGGKSNLTFQWQIVANRADEKLPSGRIARNADARFEPHRPPEKTLTAPGRGCSLHSGADGLTPAGPRFASGTISVPAHCR
jgi:hypothetical protein